MGGTLLQPVVRGNSGVPVYNWRLAIARFGLVGFYRLRDDSGGNLAGGNLVGLTLDKGYDNQPAQEGSRRDKESGGRED